MQEDLIDLRQERLGYLDSARGLAAMCVLLVHAIASFSETNFELLPIANFTRDYLDIGKVFLILFFLTSGFVIPFSIKGKGANALKSFAISRFFRLYPVYWVSAILGFVLYGTFTYSDLIMNLTMLQQFFGFENIIGLYWTLQIELIFYFLVALTFIINRLYNKRFLFQTSVLFLVLALAMAIVRNVLLIKLPLAVPLTLSIMYFGSYFRYFVLDKDLIAKKFSNYYFIIYVIAIPIISYLGYNHDFGYDESWDKYTLTYFLGLLIFVGICKFKYTSNAMEYSGKISYSVYVFHPLTILVIQKIAFFDSVNGFLKVILVLVTTMLFSHLTYYTIEKQSIGFGRKLRKRIVKGQ